MWEVTYLYRGILQPDTVYSATRVCTSFEHAIVVACRAACRHRETGKPSIKKIREDD